MNLYAEYIAEREGNSLLTEPWGFVEYRLALPFLRIESFFVTRQERHPAKTRALLKQVEEIARQEGATHLWSQVWVGSLNATQSLRSTLAYGFKVQGAENGVIILTKQVTEDSNG